MESSAVLRSFYCTVSQIRSFADKPGMLPVYNARRATYSRGYFQGLMVSEKLMYSPQSRRGVLVSCTKTTEAAKTTEDSSVLSDIKSEGTSPGSPQSTVFPNGYEALMLEVCDETEIAELKLKIGDFQMHIKRKIGATSAPVSTISPAVAPPIPSPPMEVSAHAPPPTAPKSSPAKVTPFNNGSIAKSPKLAALEASGSNGYVLVTSPTVGSFRRGRTVKGKKQPPIFNEGDLIKEGQVIGYVDQFGTELPVKSDVGGEVLKLLFNDGDAVGYGDALIAVLPSFHGIGIP